MLNNQTLRRMAAVLVLTAMAVGTATGLLMAQASGPKQTGDALAAYFKIGNRPAVINVEEIEKRIANFPDFGEGTIKAMKASAPIDSVPKLTGLKNAKGRALLSAKQVVLLLTFYNLKP
jgi:hypothetical protein